MSQTNAMIGLMNDASDRCAMEGDCYCPHPDKDGWFTNRDSDSADWDRTKDHYPQLKSLKGTLLPGNVRPMHTHCNRVDYRNLILEAWLLTLKDEEGRFLQKAAVDHAMESHLRALDGNHGRLPPGHGKPQKTATRIALRKNDELKAGAESSGETPLLDRWRLRSTSVFRDEAERFRKGGGTPSPELWRYVEGKRPVPDHD